MAKNGIENEKQLNRINYYKLWSRKSDLYSNNKNVREISIIIYSHILKVFISLRSFAGSLSWNTSTTPLPASPPALSSVHHHLLPNTIYQPQQQQHHHRQEYHWQGSQFNILFPLTSLTHLFFLFGTLLIQYIFWWLCVLSVEC